MTWRRLGQLALIMLVFVLAGPVIGLLVAAVTSGLAIAASGDPGGGMAFAAFLLIYGWLFAHLVGLVPAAIAGAVVAAYAWLRGRVPLAIAAAAGVAGMGQMVLRLGMPRPDWQESGMTVVAVIWLVVHVISAIACSRLTRRWQ